MTQIVQIHPIQRWFESMNGYSRQFSNHSHLWTEEFESRRQYFITSFKVMGKDVTFIQLSWVGDCQYELNSFVFSNTSSKLAMRFTIIGRIANSTLIFISYITFYSSKNYIFVREEATYCAVIEKN